MLCDHPGGPVPQGCQGPGQAGDGSMQKEYWWPDCLDKRYLDERRERGKDGVGAALGEDMEEDLCATKGR